VDTLEHAFLREHCAPGLVLEIGAGTGRLTTTLASLASRLIAVDVTDEMLTILRSRLHGAGSVRSRRLSAFDIAELEEFGQFDTVVCLRTLPHLPDAGRALSLMQQALRPGGKAIFDLWSTRSLYFALRTLARRRRVATHFLSPPRMRRLVAGAHLQVEACRGWGLLLPVRSLFDRLDERRRQKIFDAVEGWGGMRLPGAAHAVMFSCVSRPAPS
jgi:SAM-dependent methyltransferase